jgi:hypothetical protein
LGHVGNGFGSGITLTSGGDGVETGGGFDVGIVIGSDRGGGFDVGIVIGSDRGGGHLWLALLLAVTGVVAICGWHCY